MPGTFSGERTVTDRVDHDGIVVTAARGDFRAVKLTVRCHAVEVRDLKIHFANGAVQDVQIRRVIPAGGETRVVDLVGDDRVIQRIELTYDAQSLGGKAVVRVFGRRGLPSVCYLCSRWLKVPGELTTRR